jgi:hypothetical protein
MWWQIENASQTKNRDSLSSAPKAKAMEKQSRSIRRLEWNLQLRDSIGVSNRLARHRFKYWRQQVLNTLRCVSFLAFRRAQGLAATADSFVVNARGSQCVTEGLLPTATGFQGIHQFTDSGTKKHRRPTVYGHPSHIYRSRVSRHRD